MNLINNSSCCLVWNGEITETIKPSRGLRQEDPMWLYIFIFCLEKLGHWIHKKMEEGIWRPLKASRGRMGVPHFFFADDLLLIAEAEMD